jgi:hypothetical protein
MPTTPPWLFPAPVRRSRFVAEAPQWRRYNIEVALDRIPAYALARKNIRSVLLYDYQTHPENNTPGRLGSGRAGIYRNYYVKGVGRTHAAGNWNDLGDRYQGSGHLSVASALRERLITLALQARGLGDAIVPCESILLGRFKPEERRAAALGHSSSQSSLTPADDTLMALSVKPADFARISNIVWAFDHFSTQPDYFGSMFLDFERYLNSPDQRDDVGGEPAAIANAIDRAFRRGLANFQRFERAGLFWIYTHNNFTLDGRYVDLETPLYFGAPLVGGLEQELSARTSFSLLGFEGFSFVAYWRLFLRWLREKLRFLSSPGVLDLPILRLFVAETAKQIRAAFPPGHLLYDDAALQQESVKNLAGALDLARGARPKLAEFARHAFAVNVNRSTRTLPDLGWSEVDLHPAPISVAPARIIAPAFLKPAMSADGEAFAAALESLGAERDPQKLIKALAFKAKAF